MPVIDAHSHIYPDKIACKASSAVGDFYGVDMNAKNASAASMLAACEGSPITHHLVHSVATTPGQVPIINDFIAEQCRQHPEFIGFMATTTLSASLPCIKISKTWKAKLIERFSWD